MDKITENKLTKLTLNLRKLLDILRMRFTPRMYDNSRDSIEREHPAYEIVMSKVLEDALNSESSERINKGEVRDWLNSLIDEE
jgi:hypothetical protein